MDSLQPPPFGNALLIAAILAIGNAFVILQVWLGARGSLDVTGYAGLRTPWTRRSQQAWEAGHRAALPWAVTGAGCAILAAIASVFFSGTATGYLMALAIAVACALIGAVGGWVVANAAAKREELSRDPSAR